MRLFFISLKKSFSCHALTCEIQIGGLSSSVDSALLVRYLSTWESDCVTTSEKWPRLFEQRPEYFKWNLC
jgi:hypothetical protein